jgi:2,3,4,5-tetrahydropyridine-2-carboxylate N-succinyltransferase
MCVVTLSWFFELEAHMTTDLREVIEAGWERRAELKPGANSEIADAVEAALSLLDSGQVRVAEKRDGAWVVNEWLKKAVLLSFRLSDNQIMGAGLGAGTAPGPWWDKVPTKFEGWTEAQFRQAGFRCVPGSVVRRSAYIAPNAILMPSFVNVGAYVGEGTMIDTWATVGSCAQVGKNCHISGGVGLGGVLEPLQAAPVIIEDNVFIGARSEVAEGVIVGEGSVLSMGVYLGASTKIVDRATGEVLYGRVPPYSVVVAGTLAKYDGVGEVPKGNYYPPALYCAVIVKRVDAQTRSKTSINDLLRE